MEIKTLADKALLVRFKRSMYSPYTLDAVASATYGAGNVSKHLFKSKDNRVREATAAFTAVYQYHMRHTLPWLDDGLRLLRTELYFDYTQKMRELINEANATVQDLKDHWDFEVSRDMIRLNAIRPGLARLEDYPADPSRLYNIALRFLPVPQEGDFRVEISPEDRDSLQRELEEAEKAAATHVITSMLEPMRSAIERLTEYRGDKGQRFHDSTITNLEEVADRMAKVAITDDPHIRQAIADLKQLATSAKFNIPVLKESEVAREVIKEKVQGLVDQFAGLV